MKLSISVYTMPLAVVVLLSSSNVLLLAQIEGFCDVEEHINRVVDTSEVFVTWSTVGFVSKGIKPIITRY